MLEQHKSHLVSTYTTVLQHLAEIRQVAAAGKTPGGGRVAPLPDNLREPLLAGLDAVAARLERLVQSFVPDWNTSGQERGGPAATLMWVNILMRTIEELVHALLPDRMGRKYGPLSPAQGRRLQADLQEVLQSLREAMQAAEGAGKPS